MPFSLEKSSSHSHCASKLPDYPFDWVIDSLKKGCLTIAMANPEDSIARTAVCQALSMAPHLVKVIPG
jgi:hypothetical protein